MRFPENNYMIKAVLTYRSDQAFAERILPRTPRRRQNFLDANCANPFSKLLSINAVTIPQQIPRFAPSGKRLNDLLASPVCCRMFGHIVMHDSPTVVGENDQNKQDAKRSSGHHEEVDGDQVLDMIVQERSPRLGGRFPLSRHQSGDRPFRDLNPQFLQFPVDSGTSPGRIRIGHFANQIADVFACSWSAGTFSL
jgi:hypothetical protein